MKTQWVRSSIHAMPLLPCLVMFSLPMHYNTVFKSFIVYNLYFASCPEEVTAVAVRLPAMCCDLVYDKQKNNLAMKWIKNKSAICYKVTNKNRCRCQRKMQVNISRRWECRKGVKVRLCRRIFSSVRSSLQNPSWNAMKTFTSYISYFMNPINLMAVPPARRQSFLQLSPFNQPSAAQIQPSF